MPDPACTYYFDTVCLSNFALTDRLGILAARYGARLHITQEVLGEILDGIVAGYAALAGIETALNSGLFTLAPPLHARERGDFRRLLRNLAAGEASCIACARSRGGVVVTDDRAAREWCRVEAVTMTGTIGILKACCLSGALSPRQADALLSSMVEAGYRSPVRLISSLL